MVSCTCISIVCECVCLSVPALVSVGVRGGQEGECQWVAETLEHHPHITAASSSAATLMIRTCVGGRTTLRRVSGMKGFSQKEVVNYNWERKRAYTQHGIREALQLFILILVKII